MIFWNSHDDFSKVINDDFLIFINDAFQNSSWWFFKSHHEYEMFIIMMYYENSSIQVNIPWTDQCPLTSFIDSSIWEEPYQLGQNCLLLFSFFLVIFLQSLCFLFQHWTSISSVVCCHFFSFADERYLDPGSPLSLNLRGTSVPSDAFSWSISVGLVCSA